MSDNYFKLRFPSKSANESFARAAVAAFAATLDPTVNELADVKTAVSEAVTNSIVHGYAEGTGEIVIEAHIRNGELKVSVKDYGCGIRDIKLALEPTYTTAQNGERSGLGFSVMKAFMDKLTVRSVVGKGTTVIMTKRLEREHL